MASTVSERERLTALRLSDAQIQTIQEFMDKNIGPGQSLTAKKMFAQLSDHFDDIHESVFLSAVSCNVRMGRITGFVGRKGLGYILADGASKPAPKPVVAPPVAPPSEPPAEAVSEPDEAEEPEETKAAPEPPPEPPKLAPMPPPKPPMGNRTMRHVWVHHELYKVPTRTSSLYSLVTEVLGGMQKSNGSIVFDGKQFSVPDEDMFVRLLKFHGARSFGLSEPVLDDGSGIPVELRLG